MGEDILREGSIGRVFRSLQVLHSRTICAVDVHGSKAYPKRATRGPRAFAGTFKGHSASNIVVHGYHIRHGGMFTSWKTVKGKGTARLPTEEAV
eukprot:scaffold183996_cov18-Tisochrysis_lutea.AAC.1